MVGLVIVVKEALEDEEKEVKLLQGLLKHKQTFLNRLLLPGRLLVNAGRVLNAQNKSGTAS